MTAELKVPEFETENSDVVLMADIGSTLTFNTTFNPIFNRGIKYEMYIGNGLIIHSPTQPPNIFHRFMLKWLLGIKIKILSKP